MREEIHTKTSEINYQKKELLPNNPLFISRINEYETKKRKDHEE